jgi:hypothetical protein
MLALGENKEARTSANYCQKTQSWCARAALGGDTKAAKSMLGDKQRWKSSRLAR